jgi:hypothetical protein
MWFQNKWFEYVAKGRLSETYAAIVDAIVAPDWTDDGTDYAGKRLYELHECLHCDQGRGDQFPNLSQHGLRKALAHLVELDWLVCIGREYRPSETLLKLMEDSKPFVAEEERAREKISRERRAKREAATIAYWKTIRERQNGRCYICDHELPGSPTFVTLEDKFHHGDRQQMPPFVRSIAEVGDILACRECYGKLTHIRTAEQCEELREITRAYYAERAANPNLIPEPEAKRILHVSTHGLRLLLARGLACKNILGKNFFDRRELEGLSARL